MKGGGQHPILLGSLGPGALRRDRGPPSPRTRRPRVPAPGGSKLSCPRSQPQRQRQRRQQSVGTTLPGVLCVEWQLAAPMRARHRGVPWRAPQRGAGLPAPSSPRSFWLVGCVPPGGGGGARARGSWPGGRGGRDAGRVASTAGRRVSGSAEAPRDLVRTGAGTRTAVPLRPQTRMAAAAAAPRCRAEVSASPEASPPPRPSPAAPGAGARALPPPPRPRVGTARRGEAGVPPVSGRGRGAPGWGATGCGRGFRSRNRSERKPEGGSGPPGSAGRRGGGPVAPRMLVRVPSLHFSFLTPGWIYLI